MKKELKEFYYSYQNDNLNDYQDINNLNPELEIKTKMAKARGRHLNYFDTKEESRVHFIDSFNQAIKKYNKAVKASRDLQKEYEFCISYDLDGDTHGLFYDYLLMEITVNGYDFRFNSAIHGQKIDNYLKLFTFC